MKRQFMHTQPPQKKKTSGHTPSNASPSQPEHVSTPPKKNGSGLLSSYNAEANNAQQPQSLSKPTPASSLGKPRPSTQASRTEASKQNRLSSSPVSKERETPLALHPAASSPQMPTQQPPPRAPQRPAQQAYQTMPAQTHLAANVRPQREATGIPATRGPAVANNPSNGAFPISPAPAIPNNYPQTGNLAFRSPPSMVSPPGVPNYSGGAISYNGFPPMQQMPEMRPSYNPYSPPPPFKVKRQRRFPTWARLATGFVAFILLIAGGLLTYYETEIAPTLNNIIGRGAIHLSTQGGNSVSQRQAQVANAGASALSSQNRINILLLGSDTDGKNGAPLAQSDIVVTIDQQTHYVGMLSIPRDLQVTIPNHGRGKMDFAFSYGWQTQTGHDPTVDAEAGAGLAEDTIQQNYGIHIDRYAWVGLAGFVKVIDTAGGVDVDVMHPMVDDTYPDDVANSGGSVFDYKRLYIGPGPQHLNGPQALEYVRTRHSDLIGDFGRSARQQQVLSALKLKLATPDSIAQLPQLLTDLNGYLLTDMQLNDLVFLGNLARNIDLNNVQRITLSPPYSSPSSQNSNYLPNCSQIITIIAQMFGIQPNCLPQDYGGTAALASLVAPSSHPNLQDSQPAISQNQQVHSPKLSSMNIWGGVHTLLDIMFMTVFEAL